MTVGIVTANTVLYSYCFDICNNIIRIIINSLLPHDNFIRGYANDNVDRKYNIEFQYKAREFVNKVIEELSSMWEELKIVHGIPWHSQNQDSMKGLTRIYACHLIKR